LENITRLIEKYQSGEEYYLMLECPADAADRFLGITGFKTGKSG